MTQPRHPSRQRRADHRSFRLNTLNLFAAFLEGLDIPYVVLSDVGRLVERLDGDVDVAVPQKAMQRVARLFAAHARRSGVPLVQAYRTYHNTLALVFTQPTAPGGPMFVRFDVSGDIQLRGRRLLTATELLSGRRRVGSDGTGRPSVYVPSAPLSFIHGLLKRVQRQALGREHAALLAAHWREDPAGCAAQVRRFWRGDDALLIGRAAGSGEWDEVRRALVGLRARQRRPRFSGLTWRVRLTAQRVLRLVRPPGLCVVLVGPDGSGKTSVAARLRRDLAPVFTRVALKYRRPGLYRGRRRRTPSTGRPHDKPERGRVWSILKLATLVFDFSVGYAWKVGTERARGSLVLFDRYYHDLLADPRRYPYNGPMWLARLFGRLLPSPDLAICFDAPAEIVQARKQEVPFEETARQRVAFRASVGVLRNGRVVDAAQPLEAVVAEVEGIILAHVAERSARVLGLSDVPGGPVQVAPAAEEAGVAPLAR